MPRQGKSTKTNTSTENNLSSSVLDTPPLTLDSSSTVVADKPKRSSKPKKSDSVAAVSEPVLAGSSVSESVAAAPLGAAPLSEESHAEADTDTPLAEQSIEFLAKIQQLGVLLSSLKSEYRSLEKKWTRELKSAQKLSTKRKRKASNRAPSGLLSQPRFQMNLLSFWISQSELKWLVLK
jgi:hypothetical protein